VHRLGESAAGAAARETLEESSLRVSLPEGGGEEEAAVALSLPAADGGGASAVEFRVGGVLESRGNRMYVLVCGGSAERGVGTVGGSGGQSEVERLTARMGEATVSSSAPT